MIPWWLALVSCVVGPRSELGFPIRTPHEVVGGKNVLIVLLDDVSPDRMGVYQEHPEPARTPVFDALAAQGVRFDRAYAYPTCSPTRAALLTGRHGRRSGIGFNVRRNAEHRLPFDETLIPELLADAPLAYRSAGIGKWHLEPHEGRSVRDAHRQGFAYFAGAVGNLLEPETYRDYTWFTDDGEVLDHQSEYITSREIDEAIAQIEGATEPWFLYVSLHAPHLPLSAPPPALISGEEPAALTAADQFDQTLQAADTEIGRLLAHVDLDDTVVMVLGDNGSPDEVVRPPLDPTRAKNTLFEGGIRVPWVIAGGGVPAGRVVDDLVTVLDVFPTVAEVAGLDPARPGVPLDGHSLWPLVFDDPPHWTDRWLGGRPSRDRVFVEKYFPRGTKRSWHMARDDAFKLIVMGRDPPELYDLRHTRLEGPDLLEGRDPDTLPPEARSAYGRLEAAMARIEVDLDADPLAAARAEAQRARTEARSGSGPPDD